MVQEANNKKKKLLKIITSTKIFLSIAIFLNKYIFLDVSPYNNIL